MCIHVKVGYVLFKMEVDFFSSMFEPVLSTCTEVKCILEIKKKIPFHHQRTENSKNNHKFESLILNWEHLPNPSLFNFQANAVKMSIRLFCQSTCLLLLFLYQKRKKKNQKPFFSQNHILVFSPMLSLFPQFFPLIFVFLSPCTSTTSPTFSSFVL